MKLSVDAEPQIVLAGLAIAKILVIYSWRQKRFPKRKNGRGRARSEK